MRQTMLSKDGDKLTLRMLVPVPLCGCIIGKGGQVIRGIMDDSKATISVSSQVGSCLLKHQVPSTLAIARST